MDTIENEPESNSSDGLKHIQTETRKLVISPNLIEKDVTKWTQKIDCAIRLLQLYRVDWSNEQFSEWKEAVVSCIRELELLFENRKAVMEGWLEAAATKVFPTPLDCSSEEIERELINAKLQLAQVEEENAKLELAYSRLLREGNQVAESTSVSESFMERFQTAKQRAEDTDMEREKLNEEIERVQSQLFLCRKKNQHLLEEYRALEGEWN
ncbi:THO complex subunit 5 homolog B [Galdieria sulphuraria]|nr:THO complex subunit 5 homolog B [Galdieria sulphuraria]